MHHLTNNCCIQWDYFKTVLSPINPTIFLFFLQTLSILQIFNAWQQNSFPKFSFMLRFTRKSTWKEGSNHILEGLWWKHSHIFILSKKNLISRATSFMHPSSHESWLPRAMESQCVREVMPLFEEKECNIDKI